MAPKRPRLKVMRADGKAPKGPPPGHRRRNKSPSKSASKRIIITVPPGEPKPKPPMRTVEINGGQLYVGGVPGNRGGSGRPPDEFKALLAACVSHDEVIKAVMTVLLDPTSEHWGKALLYASKYGYPDLAAASKRPPDATDQTDDALIAKLRTVYERLTRAIHHDQMSPELRRLNAAATEVAIVEPDQPE